MSKPTRILLVEDDQIDRMACRRAFAHLTEKYALIEVDTGKDALRLIQVEPPQCVLLDYQLPDMNGLEVLAELAASAAPLPVIMLTGASDINVAVEAMRQGARDYLLKDTERRYLELLPPVVDRVLHEQRVAEDKHRAETALAHAHRIMTAGELAATLAHELSQPLAAISTFSEACLQLLGRNALDPNKLRSNIEQISAQAQRAGRAIRELRAFLAKGDAEKSSVDLNALVRTACELTTGEARRHGIVVVLELAEDLLPVCAASLHVEHVVVNLVQNAIEAIRGAGMSSGTITVRTARTPENMAQVAVQDSGPGISRETARQIFEPFYTTKIEGLGMGLAISRSVVEAHGGKLWTDTDMSRGASFRFTLPFLT